MKILITTDWYEPVINGVVTSVVNLSNELKKRGHIGKTSRRRDILRLFCGKSKLLMYFDLLVNYRILLIIWNKSHDIFNITIKNITKFVNNNCLYNHIVAQSMKLSFVNTIIFDQAILADTFLFKSIP